ncbi:MULTISPECIES: hypothetical protein [Nostocales]|uniref:Uncharacterized protein n=2 Tax=Nostocales TaxID=1161 RepID=A0ABW8WRZ5_9CYAN|nr:hypothetical protein [Tolypothrix bouteillei]
MAIVSTSLLSVKHGFAGTPWWAGNFRSVNRSANLTGKLLN